MNSRMQLQKPKYKYQNASITLKEGLEEYQSMHSGLLQEEEMKGDAAEFFHSHDICHVVFGCDTTLGNEAMVETWSYFGTTVKLKELMVYIDTKEHKEIMRKVGITGTIWTFIKAFPNIIKVIARTRKMKKKWPWSDNEHYLNVSLKEIRDDFNIKTI
ncbi:hypothetical protein JYU20_00910 [Bacteroidales bacterium AH-315-I05]|nr:hypothetical protein [Bacteroidales bacterium AH-315-I05]